MTQESNQAEQSAIRRAWPDRSGVADLMALVDTYADTAATNGIRSPWAQMAREAIEGALRRAAITQVVPS